MIYRIYKYEITSTNNFNVTLPKGYKILKYGVQGKGIYLWALVPFDNSIPRVKKRFEIFGTGWDISKQTIDDIIYCDTVFIGNLVWHIFETKE